MFQDRQGRRNMVKDIYKGFNIDMGKTQQKREADNLTGVEIKEDMSMRRSLRRGYMTEALYLVLDVEVVYVESNALTWLLLEY